MAELPEVVRQRLARQAGGEHPDANLLTAFAEDALGERERTQVLAHLGSCAACREVVSLALPETPSLQAAPAPVPSGWLRWPVLRWGAVAAAVVVVAAAVMMRETRKMPAVDGPNAASLAKQQEPAAPPVQDQVRDKEVRPEAKNELAAKTRTSAPKPQVNGEASATADRRQLPTAVSQNGPLAARADVFQKKDEMAERRQQDAVAAVQGGVSQSVTQQPALQQRAAPAKRQAYEAGALGGVQQQGQFAMTQQAGPAARPAAVPAAPPQTQNEVVADTAVAAPAAPPMEVTAAKGAAKMKASLMRSSPARWRVSSEGKVERSLDAGGSWRLVPVQAGASFRAVSAVDGDVWAAGTAGALYRSSDGGQNWVRVAPRAGDVTLTSDIVRVEFTDRLRGVVTTASGENWTTDDGGRTWSVRRP